MSRHPLSHIPTNKFGPHRQIHCPECGRTFQVYRYGTNALGVIAQLRGMLAKHLSSEHHMTPESERGLRPNEYLADEIQDDDDDAEGRMGDEREPSTLG